MADRPDSPDSNQKPLKLATGVASRGLELLKVAARLGSKAVSQGGVDARQLAALVESLSKLKGAAMKIGQTMSVELRDLLPPEVVDALSRLQDQGTALSGAQVREILDREIDSSRLESFSSAPLASASIGQVHAARYQGRDIVLKVQFPGIARSIDSDLAGMGALLRGFLALTGRRIPVDSFIEELGSIFKQETDYLLEASFLKEYASQFNRWPGYRIPEVVEELTTARVLAMTRERGLKPLDWIRIRQPSADIRNRVAQRFLDLFEIEFFELGLVQTDPNFANFLIDDSANREEPVITLLDLGAAKRFERPFIEEYRRLLRLSDPGSGTSDEQVLEQCARLSLIDPREGPEASLRLLDLLRTSARPFQPALQPFDFTDAEYARDTREAAFRLAQACRYSPPPRTILFLHRKLGGLFNLAKALEARLDLRPYWSRIVGA
jgi:predicted unusual protein kinase regulating ubiquinone biosynthesis (AarF/ABC1/UbiB family)